MTLHPVIRTIMLTIAIAALSAQAVADGLLKVSPADELLIIDPKVDSQRRPTPLFKPAGGGVQIEIPPTVIVHRYYYSGDRDFQGPMIPGGPTVLVANHPVTGEQISLKVQLMPGAPRVRYTKRSILYDYGDRKIGIDFGAFSFCEPKVVYHRDSRVRRKLGQMRQDTAALFSGFSRRARIPESVKRFKDNSSKSVLALGDRIGDASGQLSDAGRSLVEQTGLSELATPRDLSVPTRFDGVTRTGIVQELNNTVRTNR